MSSYEATANNNRLPTVLPGIAAPQQPRVSTIFGASLLVVMLLLCFSPNFDASRIHRDAPLGSDFLQEWVGGHIWLSDQRAKLYAPDHVTAVQHDASAVGFTLPERQYYPMVYPPFYYMLVSPLALLPYPMAIVVWMLGLSLFAGATVYCFTRFFEPARQHWGKCLVGLIAFFPFLLSLNMGQKSVVLLCILTSTFLLLYHRKPLAAGTVFGLIAFKPHLGLVIGLAMLAKGQWRFAAGCLATVTGLIICSFVAGNDLCGDYFWQCTAVSSYSQVGGYRMHEAHNLSAAMQLMFGSESAFSTIGWLGLSLAVFVATVFALWGKLEFQKPRFALQFSTLVIATVLLSPHFYTYDLTILWLPIALIIFALFESNLQAWQTTPEPNHERLRKRVLGLCVLFFVGAGLATTIAEQFQIQLTILVMLAMMFVACQLTTSKVTACPDP